MDYYNEIDPVAAQWLRNLIEAGHLPQGVVDERSIVDVKPNELTGFRQCHFFAGIGVWAYALERAGWPHEQRVWTGSCPCQPFSAAGAGAGFSDERHLWPHFHWLIHQCRPPIVFGEQVASKIALDWLDHVLADLEGTGYSAGAADLCAAGVGAPHIRQRLYWLGHANDAGLEGLWRGYQAPVGRFGQVRSAPSASQLGGMADTGDQRLDGRPVCVREGGSGRVEEDVHEAGRSGGAAGGAGHSAEAGNGRALQTTPRPGPTNGFWADADWLFCRDGKWRPVEPGTSPLAARSPGRVGRLRAYGNAINSACAEEFVQATMEVLGWIENGAE